jgi:hypothetical protein
MKRKTRLGLSLAAVMAACAGTASATPLRLDYCVDASGGLFQYTFTLTMDNNDGSWVAGQGWDWFIFGDGNGMPSALTNFTMTSAIPGPWNQLTSSGGGHNGPTFGPVTGAFWVPNAVGDSLTWSGTSNAFLDEPAMFFSTLIPQGGAVIANFEPAHRNACTGESQGACCQTDGTCIVISGASCTNLGGIYRGNGSQCANANCPQPPTGACCSDTGCNITTQAICTTWGGVYHGDNSTCGAAGCAPATAYREIGDAGETLSTAALVNNGSGSLTTIHGSLPRFMDVDMYKIRICDPANFSALMSGFNFGAELFLFKADGTGVSERLQYNGQANLTSTFTASLPAGDFYLAAGPFLRFPQDASGQYIWDASYPTAYNNTERAPDAAGAANPVDHWDNGGGVSGDYTISLTGACFLNNGPPPCYANCDNSTAPPILNANDFQCFLNKFAAQDPTANCDGSTAPPVLNANDFQCFLNKFAAGCT